MKKELWILLILTIILVVLIVILSWPTSKPNINNQAITGNIQQNTAHQQQTEGIQVNSPAANQAIFSPLKITGSVNNGGWAGFEGQVGTVQLLDNKGNKLAEGVLKATSDWTKPPVQFKATLNFQAKYKGPATLLFSNENPSGMPSKNTEFGLPVIIK